MDQFNTNPYILYTAYYIVDYLSTYCNSNNYNPSQRNNVIDFVLFDSLPIPQEYYEQPTHLSVTITPNSYNGKGNVEYHYFLYNLSTGKISDVGILTNKVDMYNIIYI